MKKLMPALLALALLGGPAVAQMAQGPIIDAPSALKLPEAGGVLVDIRTAGEIAQAGRPAPAVAIPLQDEARTFRASFVDEVAAAAGGDRARPVALIDSDGRRSQFAAQLLASRGFTQVFAVGEGMLGNGMGPGWLARKLPLAR